MRVTATIGGTEWLTDIWFDAWQDMYLLPVKAEVRKEEVLLDTDLKMILMV